MNIRRLFAVMAAVVMALVVGNGMAAAAPHDNPVYNIKNFLSQKCVDVFAFSGDNHARVTNWTCDGQTNQRWEERSTGDPGYFYLVAGHSGKCLTVDISNADGDFGGDVVQYQCLGADTQMWSKTLQNGFWIFTVKNNGKVLDLDTRNGVGDGANIHNWAWHNGTNQLWSLVPA